MAVKQHCEGTCYAHLEAIGFEISCDQDVVERDIAVALIEAYERASNGTTSDTEDWTTTIFNSSFSLHYPDSALNLSTTAITMNLNYYQANDPFNLSSFHCAGRVYHKACVLRPALHLPSEDHELLEPSHCEWRAAAEPYFWHD